MLNIEYIFEYTNLFQRTVNFVIIFSLLTEKESLYLPIVIKPFPEKIFENHKNSFISDKQKECIVKDGDKFKLMKYNFDNCYRQGMFRVVGTNYFFFFFFIKDMQLLSHSDLFARFLENNKVVLFNSLMKTCAISESLDMEKYIDESFQGCREFYTELLQSAIVEIFYFDKKVYSFYDEDLPLFDNLFDIEEIIKATLFKDKYILYNPETRYCHSKEGWKKFTYLVECSGFSWKFYESEQDVYDFYAEKYEDSANYGLIHHKFYFKDEQGYRSVKMKSFYYKFSKLVPRFFEISRAKVI